MLNHNLHASSGSSNEREENGAVSTLRFVLDNRLVEIAFSETGKFKPTTTVLNYLRSLPGHKGVKEGCGEGDCGACTVVIASAAVDGRLVYRAIDSCLFFLPMIHGKQLIAVENLAYIKGHEQILHPVQEIMVAHNGTQCGYCTPGVVMSLFSLYKNQRNPSDSVILDALTGNLCRCTGYQSILESARKACSSGVDDHFSENEIAIADLLNKINSDKRTIEIHSAGQTYYKPFTLTEALRIRGENPTAIITAGSTDVALRQTKKKELLPIILDISDVEELNYVIEEPDHWKLGSGMKLEAARSWAESRLPALFSALSVFGSLQIRNVATLGGNVGAASPIGDTLPLLIALNAGVKVRSVAGERVISAEQFIVGYRKTAIRNDELIAEIIIPKPAPGVEIWAHKVSKRKDLDISTVSAGFSLKPVDGRISEIILAFGGMAEIPKRAFKTEKFLTGKTLTRENFEKAMKVIDSEFTPVTDARASAGYRTIVAKNLLLKFFNGLPDYILNQH
ncbi:MAG: xanthine dehydrogenase small subunit [Bacteroidetes bacterium]|nr:xanthine dehydrogenase small subunit [Bacteroidota bacterium]